MTEKVKKLSYIIIHLVLIAVLFVIYLANTERFMYFLPSILIIAGIYIAAQIYLALVTKLLGTNLKSIEWIKRNRKKIFILFFLPIGGILAPAGEELIFRAPVIIFFEGISYSAWLVILFSAFLFAISHYFWTEEKFVGFFLEKERFKTETDNLEFEVKRILQSKEKEIRNKKIANICFAFLMGIISGYCGVLYQSIWVSVGIHAIWNLFFAPALEIVVLIIYFFVYAILCLSDVVKYKILRRK